MSTGYILSVDVGTTNVKAGLYDEYGFCKAIIQSKVPQHHVEGGALVQKGDDFVELFVQVTSAVMQKSGLRSTDVKGIAFTGQMAGLIGIDTDWQAVTIWSGTMDNRQKLNLNNSEEETAVLGISGTNTPFMAKKINWFESDFTRKRSDVCKYVGLSGYVIGKIANLATDKAFLEATYLTWTGLGNLERRNWSDELCKLLGVNMDQLPVIVEATQIVGKLAKYYADECGLQEGTPIIAGAGDKIAGCIGAGIVEPGMMVDECASVAAMSLCVDEFKADLRYRTLETLLSVIPGQYYSLFYMAGSGLVLEWFIKNFAEEEKRLALEKNLDVHQILDEKAAKVAPGSDNLLCVGLLGGRALPSQPNVRGMWIGHSFTHTKAHFYRALLESFAYEYKQCLDVMQTCFQGLSFDSVRVIGGGASSDLWNEIKANVLNLNYEQLERDDFALLGTAIIGGAAIGMFNDIKNTAKKLVKVKQTYSANLSDAARYKRMASIYAKAVQDNLPIYLKLRQGDNQ